MAATVDDRGNYAGTVDSVGFVDVEGGDFRLAAGMPITYDTVLFLLNDSPLGSPAIGRGVDLSTMPGAVLWDTDLGWYRRPIAGTFDAGAYEYSTTQRVNVPNLYLVPKPFVYPYPRYHSVLLFSSLYHNTYLL